MPYRSAATPCVRHPFTAAASACSSCGVAICGECGTWIELRFRCLECVARRLRWRKFGGRVGWVALMVPLFLALLGIGALAILRPTRHYVNYIDPDYVKLHGCDKRWIRIGKDTYQEAMECR